MKTFEGQEFAKFYDDDSGAHFSDIEFAKCSFRSSVISMASEPRLRSTIRNVRLLNCEQRGCTVDAAIIEDVLIDTFRTHTLLQCWGAVFRHVTFRGRIGRIMSSPAVATGTATPEQQRAFDIANAEYYANVDWALDISEAEFDECELQRVPAQLVRRDAETQVVITREKAMRGTWRDLDLSKTYWKTSIEFFLERGDADVVLVAGKRARKYRDLLDGLKKLRDAGVAEPD
jgi:hypothetical protein